MAWTCFATQSPFIDLSTQEKQKSSDEFLTPLCIRCGGKDNITLNRSNDDLDVSVGSHGDLKQPEEKHTANEFIRYLQGKYNADTKDSSSNKPEQKKDIERNTLYQAQSSVPTPELDTKPQTSSQPAPSVPFASQDSLKVTGNKKVLSHENPGFIEQYLKLEKLLLTQDNLPDSTQQMIGGEQKPTGNPDKSPTQNSSSGRAGDNPKAFDYHYPSARVESAVRSAPTAAHLGRRFLTPERNTADKDLNRLNNVILEYPARTKFAKYDKHMKILTNHFQILYNNDKPVKLYEFRIPELEGKPKRIARAMMESIVANSTVLADNRASFATDYFCTIVAWVDLRGLLGPANPDGTHHLLNIRDGQVDLRMNLRFERQVDMQDLLRYAKMDPAIITDITNANAPSTNAPNTNPATFNLELMVNLFNIIISECAEQSAIRTIPAGNNRFYRQDAHAPLGDGVSLCTHRGYSYSVKAGVGAVLLNVNSLTSAFWRPINFADAMMDNRTWDMDMNVFSGLVVGLRVYITYDRGDKNSDPEAFARLNSLEGRIKSIAGLGRPANLQMFTTQGGQAISVADHFAANYGPLMHPRMDVVNLGSRQDPRWYPAEKLQILAHQKFRGLVPSRLTHSIQQTACRTPPSAKALVALEGLDTLGAHRSDNNDVVLPACPLFSLRPLLLQVDGGELPAPTILYERNAPKQPFEGRWNFANEQLFHRKNPHFTPLVLRGSRVNVGVANQIFRNLASWSSDTYKVAKVTRTPLVEVNTNIPGTISSALERNAGNANFALFLLDGKNIPAYSTFKDLCDRRYGLHAICLANQKCKNENDKQRWSNIILKMNLKAAGINHTVSSRLIGPLGSFMETALVLGADVTHPGPGSVPGCPSIAAIVGSVDRHAGRFLGSMRLQRTPRAEIIDEVKAMVCERIRDWINEMTPASSRYATLPKKIVYYRDGVSESMYANVKSIELKAIRNAFSTVAQQLAKGGKINPEIKPYSPKIIAIICGKRHSVRFYPADRSQSDRYDNCRPGTTVDDVVTSPYYQDFYLQSHTALKGTARPAHYFVIANDSNESVDDLRTMTHELCHTYVRAPVSVSYASPAYYADRLCERGRCYLRNFLVAPRGSPARDGFERFRDDIEQQLRRLREGQFDVRARPKPQALVEQEKVDKAEVEKKCGEYVMNEARREFEKYRSGGNPWHPNVAKTMFWM